jgi:thiol-disulfide isomerase/thioredoxin
MFYVIRLCFLWFLLLVALPLSAENLSSLTHEIEKFTKHSHAHRALPSVGFWDEQDQAMQFDAWDGQLILVYFWASWCNSCLPELEVLNQLAKPLQKEHVQLVPISVDYKGIEAARDTYKRMKLTHLDLYLDKKNTLYGALGVQALPTTLIIDEHGTIIRSYTGQLQWQHPEILQWILQFKEKPLSVTPQPRPTEPS